MSDLLTEVQPVAPFQVALMLGTEDDPSVRVHLVEQDLPTLDDVSTAIETHARAINASVFSGWNYVVYDANHNEVRRTTV